MTTRNLEYLFRPRSVAVIGATNRPDRVGAIVVRNLLRGEFAGPVLPVNPKYPSVGGILCYPNIAALPVVPDLAVICTPAAAIPALTDELGRRGTRAAVVFSAHLDAHNDERGRTLEQAMLEAARPYLLRILGPNSLGLLVPGRRLNASFAPAEALPGRVALVHQSGMLCTALLDWARSNGIGFSHFVSLGDGADVDFGDILDYLGSDPDARAILLHVESLREARKFMSAARAAARNKPVLVIKTGRVAESLRVVGAGSSSDDRVFDAAIRRAGMLRVFDTGEMFDAVETLAHGVTVRGDRLAIVTNGTGSGVLAVDELILEGGRLAFLGEETLARLDDVVTATGRRGNPVEIPGASEPGVYAQVLETVLNDPGVGAALVLHAPHACVTGEPVAQAVIEVAGRMKQSVLTSWLGGSGAESSRRLFAEAGVPTYATPDKAVRAFLHRVRYRRNQELLMETPASIPTAFSPDWKRARAVIDQALQDNRLVLNELEIREVLSAYGIPVADTRVVRDAEQAVAAAEAIGYPVAVKVVSPHVRHKSEVGGVILYQEDANAVRSAVATIRHRMASLCPDAALPGFAVQEMAYRPGAHELLVRVETHPVFGPVIVFGQGGTAADAIDDQAVGLPPLNTTLARELISRTRIARVLESAIALDGTKVNREAIELTLLQVSQLVVDVPELVRLHVNSLLADSRGVLVLDARIELQPKAAADSERLAIRPYPRELEENVILPSGREVLLRPIRPEDEARHYAFRRKLSPEDLYYRFFLLTRWDIPHSEMARLTQIDYDREMAFIATALDENGEEQTLGVVRAVTDPNNVTAEVAIIVGSELKGQGLGQALMDKIIRYCRDRGTPQMVGQILSDNQDMQRLAERFGFESHYDPEQAVMEIRLDL